MKKTALAPKRSTGERMPLNFLGYIDLLHHRDKYQTLLQEHPVHNKKKNEVLIVTTALYK